MPTLIETEIDRALESKLSKAPAAPPAAARAQTLARRPATYVVRFSPMFAEPPDGAKRRRRSLVALSIGAHVVLFLVVLLMPRRAQTVVDPVLPLAITFVAPVPEVAEPPRMKTAPKPIPRPKEKPKAPELREEPPPVVEVQKPVIPEVVAPPPPIAKTAPPREKPVVKTGLLDEGPAGPAIVASKTSRSAVTMSGFDGAAGSPSSPARPGRVIAVGFAEAPAPGKSKSSRGTAGVVQESGFGEEAAAGPRKAERAPARAASPLDSEVEILVKPKPVYTDEARELRIEGDVVLEVVFGANGILRVLGVATGLGHGLDEAAIVAAKKIQFNPAKRDGSAVDHPAKLRVVFRLA